jgi:uncharacterized protein
VVRAVLDVNVLVSALLRPDGAPGRVVEGFLRHRAFEVVLSPSIVAEAERAFAYPKVARRVGGAAVAREWLEDILVLADLVEDGEVPRVCRDPDDDKYLGAALEGRAEFVVSGDGDLLAVREHEGVLVVTPREFLRAVLEEGK